VKPDSGPGMADRGEGSTDERRGAVVDITGRVGEVDRSGHYEIPRRGEQAASCGRPAGRSEWEEGCRFDSGSPGAGMGPGAA